MNLIVPSFKSYICVWVVISLPGLTWFVVSIWNLESNTILVCEQVLRGTLAAEQEKEWELAATSLEFEYLHWKSRHEMLIGGDDISNDVITLGR